VTRSQPSAWSPPDDSLRLAEGDVHIWRWTLQKAAHELASLKALLSSDEVARAERFYFTRHHDAFIAARAGLRTTLARYLDTSPEAIAFRYGDAGKPELCGESANGELAGGEFAFNLSHSGDWAICAIARRGPLGIDIERVRAMNDAAGLARRYFAAAEVAMWESIAAEEQIAAFFRCWTRKEAYLKALGDGLRAPLDRFVVSFAPGESPRLVEASPHDERRDWVIEDLDIDQGYSAAIVLPRGLRVTHFLIEN
jgi:4'-phosphopantetheinyl transferase